MPSARKYYTPLKPHGHIQTLDLLLIPDRDRTSNHGTSDDHGAELPTMSWVVSDVPSHKVWEATARQRGASQIEEEQLHRAPGIRNPCHLPLLHWFLSLSSHPWPRGSFLTSSWQKRKTPMIHIEIGQLSKFVWTENKILHCSPTQGWPWKTEMKRNTCCGHRFRWYSWLPTLWAEGIDLRLEYTWIHGP